MKKFLYAGAVLIIVGSIMLGVLLALGRFETVVIRNINKDIPWISLWTDDYTTADPGIASGQFSELYFDIKAINVDTEITEIEFVVADVEGILVEAITYYNDKITVNESYDEGYKVLRIEIMNANNHYLNRQDASYLKITVPEGLILDYLEIESSMGTISIDSITARELDIDTSMADVSIHNASLNQLSVEMSMADFDFSGIIREKADISNTMGNIIVNLLDTEESQVGYEISNTMGSVRVGSYHNESLNGEVKERLHAPILLELENSMGNIEVNFR